MIALATESEDFCMRSPDASGRMIAPAIIACNWRSGRAAAGVGAVGRQIECGRGVGRTGRIGRIARGGALARAESTLGGRGLVLDRVNELIGFERLMMNLVK